MNFGGFVSLSTIDWRGKAVCTLFLRGCPLRCTYCHNESIQTGEDLRDIGEITEMIKTSSPFISGVVFSGGEPTGQKDALIALARYAKKINLEVGIQTNGFFPETLEALISEGLVDKVAIDYKSTWEGYSGTTGGYRPAAKDNYDRNVLKSIGICKKAWENKTLAEFEVVFTIFYENREYIRQISEKIGDVPLVLQQGEHKIASMHSADPEMTNGEYICKKQNEQNKHPPLRLKEIKDIADTLKKTVRIRTRDIGEISYNWRHIL
ncbi:MAG: anaerobic ribonucleoside-triphosphate reductase activating protein [Methanomicrobiales archaeon HGW-Methanomicrobiales-1]|nr:MAG: anaerobic ribonucleoside-triphosphate reductase activating protein [Methanomicrobiales archaeon HGW-Methanomicrobiales-1]